jgi:hypothetical protein
MVFLFKNTNGPITWGAVSNIIPTPITGLTATSTVAGQITLTWSGGIGQNVKYTYALSTGTVQSIGALTGNGAGTPYSVTITLTSTASITTTVTLTATVLGGSTSAVSNSVTLFSYLLGGETVYYPFSIDINDYASGTAVSDAVGSAGYSVTANSFGSGNTKGSLVCVNGSNGPMKLANITPSTTSFSMSIWMYFVNAYPQGAIFPFQLNSNVANKRIFYYPVGTNSSFYTTEATQAITGVNTGWNHFVFTLNSTNTANFMYVNNGSAQAITSGYPNAAGLNCWFVLGGSTNTDGITAYFQDTVGDKYANVRWYNNVILTPTQRSFLYNNFL